MNIIHPYDLPKHLIQKLYNVYILLGEDIFLLKKSQDLILCIARKKNFLEKNTINIEKNVDWSKIDCFYKQKKIFSQKQCLIINFLNHKLNTFLIKKINQICLSNNRDICTILKFNQLSIFLKNNQLLKKCELKNCIINCFTPNNIYFQNWMKKEIKEKNITITGDAFILLYKHYEGNTLFFSKILDMLTIIWPNQVINNIKIKKIISQFSIFSPMHWIHAIFNNEQERAIHILDIFFQKKYNPIMLIRFLQKDLITLINIKREQYLKKTVFIKKKYTCSNRLILFSHALKFVNFNNLLTVVRLLLQIELSIKKEHNHSVWIKLKKITLLLFRKNFKK